MDTINSKNLSLEKNCYDITIRVVQKSQNIHSITVKRPPNAGYILELFNFTDENVAALLETLVTQINDDSEVTLLDLRGYIEVFQRTVDQLAAQMGKRSQIKSHCAYKIDETLKGKYFAAETIRNIRIEVYWSAEHAQYVFSMPQNVLTDYSELFPSYIVLGSDVKSAELTFEYAKKLIERGVDNFPIYIAVESFVSSGFRVDSNPDDAIVLAYPNLPVQTTEVMIKGIRIALIKEGGEFFIHIPDVELPFNNGGVRYTYVRVRVTKLMILMRLLKPQRNWHLPA